MPTYFLAGFGMTLIVFSTTNNKLVFFSAILNNKVIIYLGKISFGLYIFHLISNFIAGYIFTIASGISTYNLVARSVFVFVAGLTLTIGFSIISYHLIEKPFLQLKKKYTTIASHPT